MYLSLSRQPTIERRRRRLTENHLSLMTHHHRHHKRLPKSQKKNCHLRFRFPLNQYGQRHSHQ
jgi:hypothetical protein